MSIRVMAKVWEHSQQKGSALLLLLAIADFADDNGKAWPSVATLAKKIRMGERYVQNLIAQLVQSGELAVEDQAGPYTANLYTVLLGVKPGAGVNHSAPLNGNAPGGEPQFAKGVNPASPKPSVKHQDPSVAGKPARARDALFDAIVEVCQVDPATAGSSIGKVRGILLSAKPPYTPDEVRAFGEDWWSWPKRAVPPTIWKLKDEIGRVRRDKPTPKPASKIRYVND